jgi:hypothetical protein
VLSGRKGVGGVGEPALIVIVAFVGLLVGLVLTDTTRNDPRRADRAGWHEPMGWALLTVAVLLAVLAAPTAGGDAPEPPQTFPPAASPVQPPAPPAAGPGLGGPRSPP